MKIKQLFYGALLAVLTLNLSCRNDDNPTIETQPVLKGPYENGIIVANEGNFNGSNASISFITKDFSGIENNIFGTNNAGIPLGDVLQNIGFSGDDAYLVLNNSNKVTIVNRYTMTKKTEFTESLVSPRYIAFAKNFVYVTNDAYGGEKYVSIYNQTTNAFVKKITMPDAAERVVEAGGNIFVQNASFGFGNKITYLDATTNTVKSEITLPNGQINKIISADNNVYAIAAGVVDSYIYKISSTGAILKTTTLTGIANANNLEIANNKFFFTSANKIYSMDSESATVPTLPLITVKDNTYSTLYGFSVINGKIITSDANGFTGGSIISVYDITGNFLHSFTAGSSTNGFYQN